MDSLILAYIPFLKLVGTEKSLFCRMVLPPRSPRLPHSEFLEVLQFVRVLAHGRHHKGLVTSTKRVSIFPLR